MHCWRNYPRKRGPLAYLHELSRKLQSPPYRRIVFFGLISCIVIIAVLHYMHSVVHQTTYTDYHQTGALPRDGISTGRQETQTVEELFQATELLLGVLKRTNNEEERVPWLLKNLDWHFSKDNHKSSGALPYGAKSREELVRMRAAVRLLHDKATKAGEEQDNVAALNYQLKVLRTREFPRQTWSNSCKGCMKYNFQRLITPRGVCSGGERIEFVNLITSVPDNTLARQAIRSTWGVLDNNKRGRIRNVFLFGGGWSTEMNNILKKESETYGDILQDDFKDGYYNLTYKVLMGYSWVRDECSNARFVMRAADDAYVHVLRVLELLHDYGDSHSFQNYQVGLCFKAFKPYRHYDFKGFLSHVEYPYDYFPPYALGTNFLTSQALTQKILKASEDVPFMCIEDAYIGLVLDKINSGCHNVLSFVAHAHKQKHKKPLLPFLCNYLYWYTYHPLDAASIHHIHNMCGALSFWSVLKVAFYTVIVMMIVVISLILRPIHPPKTLMY